MLVNSITTDKPNGDVEKDQFNDFRELMPGTIACYASDPVWRNIFNDLANFTEEEKACML